MPAPRFPSRLPRPSSFQSAWPPVDQEETRWCVQQGYERRRPGTGEGGGGDLTIPYVHPSRAPLLSEPPGRLCRTTARDRFGAGRWCSTCVCVRAASSVFFASLVDPDFPSSPPPSPTAFVWFSCFPADAFFSV
ncbi:hypothetical protein MRX96_028536 [Rhipicephalus microplus]